LNIKLRYIVNKKLKLRYVYMFDCCIFSFTTGVYTFRNFYFQDGFFLKLRLPIWKFDAKFSTRLFFYFFLPFTDVQNYSDRK